MPWEPYPTLRALIFHDFFRAGEPLKALSVKRRVQACEIVVEGPLVVGLFSGLVIGVGL